MSIVFDNVQKKVRQGSLRVTYDNLNMQIATGDSVAFLGSKDAGLDAIVDMICGADAPDRGRVSRDTSVSWAIPASSFLHKHISLAANARFVARLYEVNEREFLEHVNEMAGSEKYLHTRASDCPAEIRSAFCFSLGICLPFDHYLLTTVGIGKGAMRKRFADAIESLKQNSALILVGQDAKGAQQFCDRAYVFDEGTATFYDDMEEAAEHLAECVAKTSQQDEKDGDDEEYLQSMVNQDFL